MKVVKTRLWSLSKIQPLPSTQALTAATAAEVVAKFNLPRSNFMAVAKRAM